jgi:peptidoglycan L-alanyl-D-glutamate endopeptidase CwlK
MLKTLHPNVRELFYSFINRIAIAGIPIRVTSAKRTIAEQNALYAQGRTAEGPIVTNAYGDNSLHFWGLALDLAPLKRTWYGRTIVDTNEDLYAQMAMIGSELGIDWGFQLWHFDKPHFQYSAGLSLHNFRSGESPPKPLITPIAKSATDEQTLNQMNVKLTQMGILPLV